MCISWIYAHSPFPLRLLNSNVKWKGIWRVGGFHKNQLLLEKKKVFKLKQSISFSFHKTKTPTKALTLVLQELKSVE